MKTLFSVDDRGNVVDFYYGDEFIAKLDREATVDGVPDKLEFHLLCHVDGFESFLADHLSLMFEVKKAKKFYHNLVCKRLLIKCEHQECVCRNCDSGLEYGEKCTSCDYNNCCDKGVK